MAIEIAWADPEKTIVLAVFTGEWTWEDYATAIGQIIELTGGLEYRIDQLIDMRESGPIPRGPALTYLHRSYRLAKYKNAGISVLVGASPILHGLISALAMTNPQRTPRLFAESIEAAYTLIHEDREKSNLAASQD